MALARYSNVLSSPTLRRGFQNSVLTMRKYETNAHGDSSEDAGNSNRREEFKKKFKKLLFQAQKDIKVNFLPPKKILHLTENCCYTKLLQTGADSKDELISPNEFDKSFWKSQNALLNLAEQHAYYIEMPGRLEYVKGDFDDMTSEELLELLQNDAKFRFQRKKRFFKNKKSKQKKEPVSRKPRRSFVPTCDVDRLEKTQIIWRMMRNSEMPVVMDMGFESKMKRPHMLELILQMEHALAYNLKQSYPLPVSFVNLPSSSFVHQEFTSRSPRQYFNSYITVTDKGISSLPDINREDCIYLSPHAQKNMESFDWNKCYIIGGYVDKGGDNSQSTAKLARILGVECYKFPLEKYLIWGNVTGRRELTIDLVFKILHTVRKTDNWSKAFQHIPKRFHRGLTELGVQEASRDEELLQWYDNIIQAPQVVTPFPPQDSYKKYLSL